LAIGQRCGGQRLLTGRQRRECSQARAGQQADTSTSSVGGRKAAPQYGGERLRRQQLRGLCQLAGPRLCPAVQQVAQQSRRGRRRGVGATRRRPAARQLGRSASRAAPPHPALHGRPAAAAPGQHGRWRRISSRFDGCSGRAAAAAATRRRRQEALQGGGHGGQAAQGACLDRAAAGAARQLVAKVRQHGGGEAGGDGGGLRRHQQLQEAEGVGAAGEEQGWEMGSGECVCGGRGGECVGASGAGDAHNN
jgi:hypothetical protein